MSNLWITDAVDPDVKTDLESLDKEREDEKYIQKNKVDDSNQHLSQQAKQRFSQPFPLKDKCM